MKDNLLKLINEIEGIEKNFHKKNIYNSTHDVIHDTQDFLYWKQELLFELQSLYYETNNTFIDDTLTLLNKDWKYINDKKNFNELKSKLLVIQQNIDVLYQQSQKESFIENVNKRPKIFISHTAMDKPYVDAFVDLLETIGIKTDQLFCSSVPGYDVPEGEDFLDYIKQQYDNYNLHVFYMLSNDYYNSPIALNEMGAAWVLKDQYTIILLPGFQYDNIVGVINPRKSSVKLDEDKYKIKDFLSQIKNKLEEEFDIKQCVSDARWDKKLDEFINKINDIVY